MTEEEYRSIAEKFFGIMLKKGIVQATVILPKSEIYSRFIGFKSGEHVYTKEQWIKEMASVFREFEEREKASLKAEREAKETANKLKKLLRK